MNTMDRLQTRYDNLEPQDVELYEECFEDADLWGSFERLNQIQRRILDLLDDIYLELED